MTVCHSSNDEAVKPMQHVTREAVCMISVAAALPLTPALLLPEPEAAPPPRSPSGLMHGGAAEADLNA